MALQAQEELVQRISSLTEQAAAGLDLEIVEVQLRGSGPARLLRIYIDKPGGITHQDCELVSERVGALLDADDVIPGSGYRLEVSSPGLDRKLSKPRDFERVVGQNLKLFFKQPISQQRRVEAKLLNISNQVLDVETVTGDRLQIPLDQIQKANLKFEL